MKKIISVLLVLSMLFTLVPMAFADEEDEIVPEFLFYVENNLLRMSYSDIDSRSELAVGDTLTVSYLDTAPADIYINGEKAYHLSENECERFFYKIPHTGTVSIAVYRGDETLLDRSFTVISSGDMYHKVVKETVSEMLSLQINPFPSKEELEDAANHGFPVGNPFIPFAYVAMIITNILRALFSFTRIVAG